MNCDHQGCHCSESSIERGDQKFCSERCADLEKAGSQSSCSCGHPDCAAV